MITSAKHDPLQTIMETARDLMTPHKNTTPYISACRKNMILGSGLTLLAAVLGGIAVGAMKKASDCRKSHQSWKDQDSAWDDALDSTFDASDAVAKY